MYINTLKKIVNHYEYYKMIVKYLTWTQFDMKFYDWFKKYPVGLQITTFDFQKNYVRKNFEQAYAQMVLAIMAEQEEFEEDFRTTPSSELVEYMTQNVSFYASYMTYPELRMISVPEKDLIEIIKKHVEYYNIPESELNSVLPYIMGAENIDLGGSYSLDHAVISIKDQSIAFIEYGIWD